MNNTSEIQPWQRLDEILAASWRLLARGAAEAEHPFHTPVLGTVSRYGPSLRTVILREVRPAERRLSCYTDRRAQKVVDLQARPETSWLFYDPRQQIQLRLAGTTTLHFADEVADRAWARVGLTSRKNYLSLRGPGAPLAHAGSGLPQTLDRRNPAPTESAAGRQYFAVIICQITFLDWLRLSPEGHSRAQFIWWGDTLKSSWVTP